MSVQKVLESICSEPTGFLVFVGYGLFCFALGIVYGWIVRCIFEKRNLISIEEDALNGRR